MTKLLLASILVYLLYFVGLLRYNLKQRLKAARENKEIGKYYKNYKDHKEQIPERLHILERHIDNQFQLPTIFIPTVITFVALNKVTILAIVLAWAFVASRFLHAYIHLGQNHPLKRAKSYALGIMIIIAMWSHIIFIA